MYLKKHWIGSLYIQNKSFVFGCCRLLIYVLLIFFKYAKDFLVLLISQTAFAKNWSKNKTGCQLFFRDFSRRGKISYNQYCISIFNSFQKLYWIWHRFIGLYICIWRRGHPRWIQEVDPRWSPCMNKEKFDSFRQKSSHFLLSHHHLFYNNFFLFNFEMHCCRRRICPNQENVKFWVWIMN